MEISQRVDASPPSRRLGEEELVSNLAHTSGIVSSVQERVNL